MRCIKYRNPYESFLLLLLLNKTFFFFEYSSMPSHTKILKSKKKKSCAYKYVITMPVWENILSGPGKSVNS